jgi:hypothetical protein
MFRDRVIKVILTGQSTEQARERSAHEMVEDTQSDADAAIAQKNPPQLRAGSNLIQTQQMQVIRNMKSTLRRALQ